MLLVRCDCCGATGSAIWVFGTKSWRISAEWEAHNVWDDEGNIVKHACSTKCQADLQDRLESPSVISRRRSFRLVSGGKT